MSEPGTSTDHQTADTTTERPLWFAIARAKKVSIPLGIACGLAGLILSIAIEWQITVHPEGETFTDFITHLHERPIRNFASIIAGPLIARWFGIGRGSSH